MKPMFYTVDQIADMYGLSLATTERHIAKLKKQGRFKRMSLAKSYSEREVQTLSELLGFRASA